MAFMQFKNSHCRLPDVIGVSRCMSRLLCITQVPLCTCTSTISASHADISMQPLDCGAADAMDSPVAVGRNK